MCTSLARIFFCASPASPPPHNFSMVCPLMGFDCYGTSLPFSNRACRVVLKCGGRWPSTLRWGGGKQIWLFPLCGCLEPSDYWTFLESLLSRVMFIYFKWLKSIFLLLSLIAHAGSTTRSLQIMILGKVHLIWQGGGMKILKLEAWNFSSPPR